MSLGELYAKATNKQPIRDFVLDESLAGRAAKYRQFAVIGEDPRQTVKDSIHLDWSPLKPHCAECGVTVKMWDSFAHRLLWQQTWPRAVAFQPLSTRYETERSDSPIEGFVFRLWQWQPDVADTFLINKSVSFPKISLKSSFHFFYLPIFYSSRRVARLAAALPRRPCQHHPVYHHRRRPSKTARRKRKKTYLLCTGKVKTITWPSTKRKMEVKLTLRPIKWSFPTSFPSDGRPIFVGFSACQRGNLHR